MNMLSWNCRGLGNPRTVLDLFQMVKDKKPSFVFLIKTLCSKQCMEWIRVKLGFAGCFVVDPVGRSGGLALLWRLAGTLEIFNFSCRHINAIVQANLETPCWKLTCFYGHLVSCRRAESWALLNHLKSFNPVAWLCVGDFNEILEHSEKEGGALRREVQMDGFRNALDECQLGDLGYHGSRFTWSNRRSDAMFTKERLDRAVANQGWCTLFQDITVNILAARASGHNPVQVCFSVHQPERHSYKRHFKFEESWTKDSEWLKVLKSAWEGETLGFEPMLTIQRKLSACQQDLSRWSWRKFGNSAERLKSLTKQL